MDYWNDTVLNKRYILLKDPTLITEGFFSEFHWFFTDKAPINEMAAKWTTVWICSSWAATILSLEFFLWKCFYRKRLLLNLEFCLRLVINGYYPLGSDIGSGLLFKAVCFDLYLESQCPRADLSKKILPRPKTTIAWKLTPQRSKISKNWNPPHWDPLLT